MRMHSKLSKISIKRFLYVSILIIGISMFSTMRLNATNVSYDPPTYSALTQHDPISITSDSGLEVFPGTGTAEDPYVIEGYNITTTITDGISIKYTTKYFIVRNCYVDANNYGIYIYDVAYGTVTVINNTCSYNEWGIFIVASSSSTVANNTCSNNNREGIVLDNSSGNSTVANNTCNNNNVGIVLYSSDNSTVANNTCSKNNNEGIKIWISDFCNITYNLLQENEGYGVYSTSGSDNNNIHHNTFVDNNLGGTSQAKDDGTTNTWYDIETLEGNYWDDWSGTGSYAIDGTAGTSDIYPLDKPTVDFDPPLIVDVIHSPSTPTELDTININATVTDNSGIYNVTLHYKVNSGFWTEVSMTLISGDIYSVTIGSFAVSDTIEYYISAVDDSIHHNEATEDNSGLYYSFTIDSSDNTGPEINDIVHSPSSPTELDTISINATIIDVSGVQSVSLNYRINGGTWIEVSMTLVSGDIYTATFGSFAISDTIEYYITAVDNSINHNEAAEDNSGQYYDIFVGSSDVTGPTINGIVHSPALPTELDTITVNATVIDASGIYNVTLHYRINGGTWTEVSMTHISGDLYSVTIGSFAVSDTIVYYVSSVDDSVNYNEAINDNSGLYYSFTVSVVIPEIQMLPPLLPAIAFLFLGFGLVVQQRRKK